MTLLQRFAAIAPPFAAGYTRRTPAVTVNPWFAIPAPQPLARLRLFCFPHAGGGASAYFSWSRALAHERIEVAAVQLPGRENRLREPALTDLAAIVRQAGMAMEALDDRPFAFFGHSMGAIVAFELTRWLRARGRPLPVHLFVSGSAAPNVRFAKAPLHAIADDDGFLAAVAARYGGIPRAVAEDAEFKALIVPTLRADLRINELYAYQAGAALPVSIAAYGGAGDAEVPLEALDGWRRQTTAGFSARLFAGDHFFLNGSRTDLLADLVERTRT